MVTEEQKKIFSDFLNNTFNETIKSNEETYKKTSQWIKNVYYKCIYDTLPEEHKEALERRLKRRKITMEEFLKTKGNIDSIQELSKEKKIQKKEETKEVVAPIEEIKPIEIEDKTPKEEIQDEIKPNKKKTDKTVETKEELLKKLDELDKKYFEIDDKIRSKQKRVFNHITDEEYENKKNELNEIKKQRLEVNRKLDAIKVEEEKPKKEKEAVTKKFEELVNQSKEKDKEISELKNEILKYKEERAYIKTKYEEEYDKRFEIYSKQKDEEVNERVKDEVRKQVNKLNIKEEETKIMQKKVISNLFITGNIISLDDIKFKLKEIHIPTTKIEVAINEIRNEMPGIIKISNNDGVLDSYSLKTGATSIFDVLASTDACPRISNVLNGTVKFILDADPHIPLESTEDEIKKAREPYLQYSCLHDNIPIIGLGDYVNEKIIEFYRWQKMDPEAIELSYKFYKYFAKVADTAPKTKHYLTLGNHDKFPFLVGLNPVEIMNNNNTSNNIVFLGANKGAFMLGNDKIGVFHGLDSVALNETKGMRKAERYDYTYNRVCEEIKNYIKDYIYALIAHYHRTTHNPLQHFSLVYGPLLCTAEIKDGHVKRIFIQPLHLSKAGDNFVEDYYPNQTEIYNSNYQYTK